MKSLRTKRPGPGKNAEFLSTPQPIRVWTEYPPTTIKYNNNNTNKKKKKSYCPYLGTPPPWSTAAVIGARNRIRRPRPEQTRVGPVGDKITSGRANGVAGSPRVRI